MPLLSSIGGGSIRGWGRGLDLPGLYPFTTFTFTSCGVTGKNGPSLAQMQSAYSATSWTQNTAYFNIGAYQGYQKWTVPKTGTYTIVAGGARGGGGGSISTAAVFGAVIQGTFTLTAGHFIEIVIGQNGGANGGAHGNENGGGGGTFIKNITTGTLLLVAGGSGGAPSTSYGLSCSRDASKGQGQTTTTSGLPACAPTLGVGAATEAYGGNTGTSYQGGAGGGYLGAGANGGTHCAIAYGGGYYGNGLVGGTGNSCYTSDNYGGFGGGGGGQLGGPGGAGGYTGGCTVGSWASYSDYGGGGGSYNIGGSPTSTQGGNSGTTGGGTGYGYCTITKV